MKNKKNSLHRWARSLARLGPAGSRADRCSVVRLFRVGLCVLLLPLTGSAGSAPPRRFDLPETESIAEVNGQQISLERFNALWAASAPRLHPVEGRIPESQAIELKLQLAEQLIDEVLIEQAAEQAQISVDAQQVDEALEDSRNRFPSPEAFDKHLEYSPLGLAGIRQKLRLNLLRDRLIALRERPQLSDSHLRVLYESQPERFVSPAKVVALEFFLPSELGLSTADVTTKRRKAEALRQQASLPGASFEELASQVSESGSTAERARTPKAVGPRDVVPEAWMVLAKLKPGTVSPVIRSEQGFHFFKLVSRGASVHLPFEEMKAVVAVEIRAMGREIRRPGLLQELRANAVIVNALAERYTPRPASPSSQSLPQPGLKTDALSRPR